MTRSVMGGGDEIVSRRSDPNRGCMHGGGAMGWGRRSRLHRCVENNLRLGWVEDEISFRWIGLGWRRFSLGGLGLGGSADRCDLVGVSGGAISPMLGATRPCFWCDLLAVSLSLSLLFSYGGIHLKVKYKRKWFYRVRGHILQLTEMIFRLTQFSLRTQTPAFMEKYFRKLFEAKKNTALNCHGRV